MKIIYEYHKGEDKVTIISESPDVTRAATETLEVLKILFPPTEIRIAGIPRDKGG